MQFGYTILYVPDVPATLKFYEAAFGFKTRFLAEGGDFGELETGSTALAFCSHSLLQQMGKTPQVADPDKASSEIALCTPDVAAALARAGGGCHAQAPRRDHVLGPDDCLCGRHQRLFGGAVHAHGLNAAQIRYIFGSCLRTLHKRCKPIWHAGLTSQESAAPQARARR